MMRMRNTGCGLVIGLGLLSVISAIPGTAVGATQTTRLLYSQIHDRNQYGIVSTHFDGVSQGSLHNSTAADDFVVPTGQTWTISEVRVVGKGAHNPPVHVNFYARAAALPGALVATRSRNAHGKRGNFTIMLHHPVTLVAGTYWMSVQVISAATWSWGSTVDGHSDPAAWKNPGDGYHTGCTTWTVATDCATSPGFGPDLLFALRGSRQ
jgi:hypothetical protein